MIPSPSLGGRQRGRSTCCLRPRTSDNFIGGDFVPHGDIHSRTGVAPLGEGEDTPLDGGMAFNRRGKGFAAYRSERKTFLARDGVAGRHTRRGRGGRGRDMAHLCQT